jgi:hypothetical protein
MVDAENRKILVGWGKLRCRDGGKFGLVMYVGQGDECVGRVDSANPRGVRVRWGPY